MKKVIFYLSVLFFAQLNAQELTLAKALEIAKSPQNNQANLDVLIQEINLKIQKSKRLPLVYGDANLQRNLIVPVTPVPAIAFNPDASSGNFLPLKFATDWSAKAGLQFSLDLFNSQNQLNIKQAENVYKKSEISKKQTEIEFKNLITDFYAQTYLAQQQYEVALLNEEKYKETLEIVLLRNQEGRVSELDKNNALQKAYELEVATNEAEYVLKNKLLQLAKYIDISIFERVSTSVQTIINENFIISDLDTEQLKLEVESKQLDLENNKLSTIPKVTLNAYYGAQFFDNDLNFYKSQFWYGNSFINLSLRIPLTEFYEKNLKAKQFNYELDIAKSKLVTHEREKFNTNLQRLNEIIMLSQKIESYKQIIVLNQKNLDIMKAEVEAGTILVSDYNTAVENLFNQNLKLWQVSYDLLKKKLE